MAVQNQDDQQEHTFSSYVRIRDFVLKTCLGRWTVGRSGERESGISVLPARHFSVVRQHGLLHCDLQRQLTLSILTRRDNTHTLSYILTSSTQLHENVYILQPFSCPAFSVRLVTASNTTTDISSNHRKKQTTNTFLLTYIIKILLKYLVNMHFIIYRTLLLFSLFAKYLC